LHQRFEAKKTLANASKAEDRPQKLVDLAEWALQHGLQTEFVQVMNELGTFKKDHPAFLAFQRVQEALKKPTTENRDLARWQSEKLVADYRVAELPADKIPHYSLLQNLGDANVPEVKSRLERLEESYRNFFYWFALKSKDGKLRYMTNDKGPVVPEQRLVALLVSDPNDFKKHHHKVFGEPPLVADGFYVPRANMSVFVATRLDPLYDSLLAATSDYCGPQDRSRLLQGKSDPSKPKHSSTIALLIRALEAQSEVATISHESTRQLVTATGLLPRGVAAPEWIQFGMGSFFETPRGAPWPSVAGPNTLYLPQYRRWDKDGKLDPLVELKNVITDRYFRVSDGGKNSAATHKARTMAWALTYYLAQSRHLDELMDYYHELSRLPRDLEFDDKVLLRTFGKAFKLMDPDNPAEVSEKELKDMADRWHQFIKGVALIDEEGILDKVRKYESDPNATVSAPAPPPGRGGAPLNGPGGNPLGGGGAPRP